MRHCQGRPLRLLAEMLRHWTFIAIDVTVGPMLGPADRLRQRLTRRLRANVTAHEFRAGQELSWTLLWAPRMSRWARGTRGAGVTSTSWLMRDASILRAPRMEAPRRTMEYSISLSLISQSWATDVKGPR